MSIYGHVYDTHENHMSVIDFYVSMNEFSDLLYDRKV